MIKYTAGFVDKLEDILSESDYRVRYERGNFQSGWCLLDHKRVVVLNKFLNVEGRVNTLVDLIPQLKIDFDKLTLASQKIYEFLTANHLNKGGENIPAEPLEDEGTAVTDNQEPQNEPEDLKSDLESKTISEAEEKVESETEELDDDGGDQENDASDTTAESETKPTEEPK